MLSDCMTDKLKHKNNKYILFTIQILILIFNKLSIYLSIVLGTYFNGRKDE